MRYQNNDDGRMSDIGDGWIEVEREEDAIDGEISFENGSFTLGREVWGSTMLMGMVINCFAVVTSIHQIITFNTIICNKSKRQKIGYWGGGDTWQWIDYLYFLSFVKVGVSIVKYIPQVVLNYRRKSTSGWQIWNILLGFSGGTLSIVQLVWGLCRYSLM